MSWLVFLVYGHQKVTVADNFSPVVAYTLPSRMASPALHVSLEANILSWEAS